MSNPMLMHKHINPKFLPQAELNIMPFYVQNLAMHLYNLFYLKKSYLEYDREVVMNTCILLASKVHNIHDLQSKYLVSNHIQMSRYAQALQQTLEASRAKGQEERGHGAHYFGEGPYKR